jgi:uncharacterized protein (DUF2336 family)
VTGKTARAPSRERPAQADTGPPARPDTDATDEAARVRLAAAATTPPGTLLALAADAAVTVRAAVALNPAVPPQADHLLAADPDARVRTLLARKLASLIPGLTSLQCERLQHQTLAALGELVEDEVLRVRAAIADVVKDMPDASRTLILRLARDSAMAVSEPVIRLSPLLTPQDLLALLAAAPAPHTATAVARRPDLPEAVSDAIAASADPAAIAALLANGSAAIREATLDALIAQAADNIAWHAPLVRRPRLTARAARALSDIVATGLLDELARRADLEPEVTADLRRRLAERLRSDEAAARPDPGIAQAMVDARWLCSSGGLDENALLSAVQRGEVRMATALLAVAAEVPASVVDHAATLRSAKGLVSLMWKAGFTMRIAGPLQMLLGRLPPTAILRATGSGGFPLAEQEMRWQIDFLARAGR